MVGGGVGHSTVLVAHACSSCTVRVAPSISPILLLMIGLWRRHRCRLCLLLSAGLRDGLPVRLVLQALGVDFTQMRHTQKLPARQLATLFQKGVQIHSLILARSQSALQVVEGIIDGVDVAVQVGELRGQSVERDEALFWFQGRFRALFRTPLLKLSYSKSKETSYKQRTPQEYICTIFLPDSFVILAAASMCVIFA